MLFTFLGLKSFILHYLKSLYNIEHGSFTRATFLQIMRNHKLMLGKSN
ncbi:hypothetical protein C1752_12057 [Acaryochloris thomasi RCC1774]|uniref:Uncharacterized protein n=1 Tax=Acaryochloris thomasi RCC1774 TaxID=1764569 RepID=A0A2W1J8M4_9CYAN|nr:hypothetical protein C1752_12057 [Acaryochloris thomasi RCC1774]